MRFVRLAGTLVALFFAPMTATAWETPHVFRRGIVCPNIKLTLMLSDAFMRSTRYGWQLYAMENGRSRGLEDNIALIRGVCKLRSTIRAYPIFSLVVNGRDITAYRDPAYLQRCSPEWCPYPEFFVIQVGGEEPNFNRPRLIDRPSYKDPTLFAER